MGREPVNDEELRRLYVEEGLSLNEVAVRAGQARSTVTLRLAALGVEIRSKGRPRGPVPVVVDGALLRQLYEIEGMGVHAVAAQLGVGRSAVVHALDRLGVPRHSSGAPRRPNRRRLQGE